MIVKNSQLSITPQVMKKPLVIVAIVLTLLVGGFFLLNNYIYQAKQASNETSESYRGTLAGEYVCLPRTDGGESDECVYGMKTDVGEYYAVDFSLMSQVPDAQLSIGDRFQATGLITPIENLSTSFWDAYPVEGIFSVTDSVERE